MSTPSWGMAVRAHLDPVWGSSGDESISGMVGYRQTHQNSEKSEPQELPFPDLRLLEEVVG